MFIDRLDEEFLLFALNRDGELVDTHRGAIHAGVAGAWLAEMLMHNRIKVEHDRVVQRSHSDFGEPVMDGLLRSVWRVRRPRRVRGWVQSFARQARRRNRDVLQRLADRGFLEKTGRGRKARYAPRGDAQSHLRRDLLEILHGRRTPDESTVALIALLDAAGLLGHAFGRGEEAALHTQAQLLQRSYRSISLIADGVRGKSRSRWRLWRRSARPVVRVRGKTVRQSKPLQQSPVRFDPKSGGRDAHGVPRVR
ncbi:MAG: GOLPH3/VPS74 family protein [Thermoplasmatota archaeon]